MTLLRREADGTYSIDWERVESEYGQRACLHALDIVMTDRTHAGLTFDWDATKAAALAILRDDFAPGSSVRAGLRDPER